MERMTDYKPKEWQDLEELYRQQNVRINELEKENKKLKRQIDDWKDKYSRLDRIAGENVITLDVMNADIIELKEENEELKEKLNKA
jgi:cell division protein FtsB